MNLPLRQLIQESRELDQRIKILEEILANYKLIYNDLIRNPESNYDLFYYVTQMQTYHNLTRQKRTVDRIIQKIII